MSETWQPGDRVQGDRPQDQGMVESHVDRHLVICCDDGGVVYTSQQTAEALGWRSVKTEQALNSPDCGQGSSQVPNQKRR